MQRALAFLAPTLMAAPLLAACATTAPVNADGASEVRLNQWADVDGPRVRVLRVLEDSRCPMEARCAWAGRVRVEVEIELDSGRHMRELASDAPLPVADGALELLGVMPPTSVAGPIAPDDYHFALKFSGGL